MAAHEACIVGAGSSGIVAAKTLHERRIPFVCLEKGSGIGGNWRYENDNGMSAAYRSLHINTSREKMAYADFPMPESYPDFAHHTQILDYFEAYVDHFGFRDAIRFKTEVVSVEPDGEGAFVVETVDAEGSIAEVFGAVIVANGHHWASRMPSFPGSFDGTTVHAHDYRTPEPYAGKRVVVLGVGNSGVDIACDICPEAERVYLASRRGAHVIPKYILGRPLDAWTTPVGSRAPLGVQRFLMERLLRVARGDQEAYGFPKPEYRLLSEHPTVSSNLLSLVRSGSIIPKPTVSKFEGTSVRFADGTHEPVDAIIYATGYSIRFPFLDNALLPTRGDRVELYGFVVPPDIPNLYYVGLIQPLGAIMPLAEKQSAWVADLLDGSAGLPRRQTMVDAIRKTRERMARRYVESPRHTIQVDFYPYSRLMDQLRKSGRRIPANRSLRHARATLGSKES